MSHSWSHQLFVCLTNCATGARRWRSLNGLGYFSDLDGLDLRNNQIIEIKGLNSLRNLRWIKLNNNRIKAPNIRLYKF